MREPAESMPENDERSHYGEAQAFAKIVCYNDDPVMAGVIDLGEAWD